MENKYYMQNRHGEIKTVYLKSDNEAFEYAQKLNWRSSENWKSYDSRGNLIYYVVSQKR